jgi:hypothetical protein
MGQFLFDTLSHLPSFQHPYIYSGNNPVQFVDPLGLWYVDFNVNVGLGLGVTFGVMIGSDGQLHPYLGGGFMSGPGASLTLAPGPQQPTPGWNWGVQAGIWGGWQVGNIPNLPDRARRIGERQDSKPNPGPYIEIGFVTPGISGTWYYVW